MKTLVLLPATLALVGAGFVVGLVLSGEDGSSTAALDESEVVVRTSDGDARTYTAAEAAARIEQLETLVRRRAGRESRRASVEEDEREAADALARFDDGGFQLPTRSDGRPYSFAELVRFAMESDDPDLRKAAIRRLRRINTPQSREALKEILVDAETPAEVRMEAAAALSRWPHRDQMTEDLVTLLVAEEDPAVRAVIAEGVARLRERGAWMLEISAQLAKETDPAVRASLLRAVTQASRDPAARSQLMDLAASVGAPLEERQAALRALTRGRPEAELRSTVGPLLDDPDPRIRQDALRILANARNLPVATLNDGLTDDDPAVRRTALESGLRHLRGMLRNKKLPKDEVAAAVKRTASLASSDPDPLVRRAAINGARYLPKKDRNEVLAQGRTDTDERVRLAAYASSGTKTAKQATPGFLSALSSDDAGLRGFAYNQLKRLYGVTEPYNPRWNDKARSDAAAAIRQAVETTPSQ